MLNLFTKKKKVKDISILMSKGFDAVENCEIKKAIKIGKKLKKLRHSSAFEILAMAYHSDNKLQKAIKTLQEGVKCAPNVGILWQLLGNYQSENFNFDEAQIYYQKALSCSDYPADSIKYNSALAYLNSKEYEKAANECDLIDLNKLQKDENYKLFVLSTALKIEILNCQKHFGEANEISKSILEKNWDTDILHEEIAYFYASHAETLINIEKSNDAITFLWKSIELDKNQKKAQWLIREIENRYSENSKYFRILIEGTWSAPFEGEKSVPGFFTSYDVVADSLEDALNYIKKFEPAEISNSLKISKFEEFENDPENPQGVYKSNGYAFFKQ